METGTGDSDPGFDEGAFDRVELLMRCFFLCSERLFLKSSPAPLVGAWTDSSEDPSRGSVPCSPSLTDGVSVGEWRLLEVSVSIQLPSMG